MPPCRRAQQRCAATVLSSSIRLKLHPLPHTARRLALVPALPPGRTNIFSAAPSDFCCNHPRFSPAAVRKVIDAVLLEKLTGKEYTEDDAKEWSIEVCEDVKAAVKGACTLLECAAASFMRGGWRLRGARVMLLS